MNDNNRKVYCTFQDASAHRYPGHPESPQRFHNMWAWLEKPPYSDMTWLNFHPAEESDVTLIHRKELLTFLQRQCQLGAHQFEPSPSYVTQDSYQAALAAVGATLAVSQKIISNESGHGFAIVRPPGHHAEPMESMGFCLLNNVAIAAADAIARGLHKVAIVDFDAHHGNGTQAAFIDTPEVGYLSTHEQNMYPGTGRLESPQHAEGRIINIPLPAFSGNRTFQVLLEHVVTHWLRDFRADMLFVSAGYDAHFSDPLTTLTLDTQGFFQLSKSLVSLADHFCHGRVMFVLEGGYDPLALRDNVQASLAALCYEDQYPDHYGKAPGYEPDISRLINQLIGRHHLQEK
ncbi:MAG: histone deacetylase [Anaerolineales bacterium]